MDDPYKLPLPTIPHKTMAVHGTPRSAGGVLLHAGVLPLPQRLVACCKSNDTQPRPGGTGF